MQKTIGGDRLGSGKKLKVNLHNYERSTHDLGYLWRSTMAAGTLIPFLCEVALPADTFDINLECDIKTHPTIGPLFGSYKVQLDVFQAPIRLYNSLLHNNALGIGLNMQKVKLPTITLTAKSNPSPNPIGENKDLDNSQINPSCLLSYIGIRGVGLNRSEEDTTREFNALPILTYWDIYKNYYANKQEEIGVVIHTPSPQVTETIDEITMNGNTVVQAPANGHAELQNGQLLVITWTGATPTPSDVIFNTADWGPLNADQIINNWVYDIPNSTLTGTYIEGQYGLLVVRNWKYKESTDINQGTVQLESFPLTNIDDMRNAILAYQSETVPFSISPITGGITPYIWLAEENNNVPNSLSSQEGLGIKTYQSDLFNNWIQTEWIDGDNGISAVTSVDTSGGSFTIDTLNLSRKVYDMLNRIAISGGTYDDWLDAVYAHDRYQRCETPMYMGGLSKELVFQEVVSNSQTTEQPLGTLAGKGVMSKKNKGGHVTIKVDEPSYIIGIISLTPRIDYSQGNKWDVHLETLNDLHKPALDEIGFQELITEQMTWWDTEWDDTNDEWITKSAGKQPAWINYMTNVNQTRGNFAITSNEMFMTLNRRYERNPETGEMDLTTYIDPSKFNFIFAETSLDSQNFWAQIAVDITARRKMSAKIMPNL